MTDFTLVKKYLLEIIDLKPEILGDKLVQQIKSPSIYLLPKSLIPEICKRLMEFPKGRSINKEGVPKLIVLSILVIDELIFSTDNLFQREYFEFRFKVFTLFMNNNLDAEAACIYDNLKEINRRIENNDQTWNKRLKEQVNVYSKKIRKKLEDLEKRNNYNEAQFLNSIYSLYPEYEFEARLQEKESKYIRMPFFEIMVEIILPVVLLSALLGINAFTKNYQGNNVLSYFTKGDFTFNDLILGFFVIYLIFWIFKILEFSKLNVRWTILLKILIIGLTISIVIYFVNRKFEKIEKKYFPNVVNTDTVFRQETRVLITEFNNIEEHSVFDRNNSEIKISQLFYKKILEKNEHKRWNTDSIIFDHYPQKLVFEDAKSFKEKQKKGLYDIIVSGAIFDSNNESEKQSRFYITNSCYIVDSLLERMIQSFDRYLALKGNDDFSFLTYFTTPLVYYEEISIKNQTTDKLKCDIGYILGISNYDIQNLFPRGKTFVESLDESPHLIYNYVSFLHLWKLFEHDKAENEKNIEKIIYCLDNLSSLFSENDFSKSNIEFKINLYLLKAYFINQKILFLRNEYKKTENDSQDEVFNLWALKIELMAKAIETSLLYNNISQEKIDFLIASFYFTNYDYLAYTLGLADYRSGSLNNPYHYNESYSNLLIKNVFRIINKYEMRYDSLLTFSDKYYSSVFDLMELTLKFHLSNHQWKSPDKYDIESLDSLIHTNKE